MTDHLVSEIVENLCTIGEKVVQKVEAGYKREVQYELGQQLNALRKECPSNEEFGNHRSAIIEKIAERGFKKPADRSLLNLQRLPEFGSLTDCELVGFTNVYKLTEPSKAKEMATVKQELAKGTPKKELSSIIKGLIQPPKKGGDSYSMDEMMEFGDRTAEKVKKMEFMKDLGLDDDSEDGDIKYAIRMLNKKYHPDTNPEDPRKYHLEFERLTEKKEFFRSIGIKC